MKIAINEKVLEEHGLTMTECLFLLFNAKGGDIKDCVSSLIKKGWVNKDLFDWTKVVISNNRKDELSAIIIDSEEAKTEIEFESLADKLRELYPKGRKAGTNYMWRDTTQVIARKLKTLVTKYNAKFTEEQAIKATQEYISSFNGDYRFMQLLKYFILKTPVNANGDVEIKSEFLSYIENAGNEDNLREDWVSNMV